MTEFLDMGGYAKYVWPSYLVTFALIVLNIIWARRALARAKLEAQRRIAMSTEQVPAGERA
jgi:heme exporter protein CcmD